MNLETIKEDLRSLHLSAMAEALEAVPGQGRSG